MSDPDEITSQSAWIGRAVGVLQVLGGSLEAAGGVGLLLVPDPTFLTKAGGTILVAHSADTIAAGLQSIWYGSVRQTLTQQGAAATARAAGATTGTSEMIGTGVDIAAGIGPSLATQAARMVAIQTAQQATDRVAIAWLPRALFSYDHVAVGVGRGSQNFWFHLAGDVDVANGVSFMVRRAPAAEYVVTEIAVPAERAVRALQASDELINMGAQTWGLFGPNCATTALHVVQQAGIAVPAWARAPAALHIGVTYGYAITAAGSFMSGASAGFFTPSGAGVQTPVGPPAPVAAPARIGPPAPVR